MRTASRQLAALWPVASLMAGLLVVVLILGASTPDVVSYLIQGLVTMIVVIGLYIFVGNSGVVSLGHATFMGVGAYVGGILSIPALQRQLLLPALPSFLQQTDLSLWPAAATGAVVAGVIGFLVAIPLSRLSGLAAAVATLALLQIFQVVAGNWSVLSSSGGTTAGIPTDTTSMAAYLAVIIVIAVAYLYQRSPSGIRLRSSSEDPMAAMSTGVNIRRERRLAFALSAAVAGFGGAFYVHSVGALTSADYYVGESFLVLAMLVVGGVRSLAGAVTGAAVLATVTDAITRLEGGQGLGPFQLKLPNGVSTALVAVILIGVLIIRPAGLTNGREVPFPGRLRLSLPRRLRPLAGRGRQQEPPGRSGAAGEALAAPARPPDLTADQESSAPANEWKEA